MSEILSKGTMFPAMLMPELVNLVRGKSALAALTQQTPIAFNGQTEFVFTMDKEVDVVAENGAKSTGGVSMTPVTIQPIKVEYGARISDEFMLATEGEQLNYYLAFMEGFAAKLAHGFDLMALHGLNPRTGEAAALIGNNCFAAQVTQTVPYDAAVVDENIEAAISMVQEREHDATGIILAPAARTALAAMRTEHGARIYPDLTWGAMPDELNGLAASCSTTLSSHEGKARALVGNFADCFRWGYAKEVPVEVIEYGNPDNDEALGDLKGHNQVYLRAEAYIGWGILDPDAFAYVMDETEEATE